MKKVGFGAHFLLIFSLVVLMHASIWNVTSYIIHALCP